MWWHDAMTVTVISLIMVALITALVSAVLVLEPAMAARCDECGRAMFDSHLDGSPVCLHRRLDHHLPTEHGHHDRADSELTTASGGAQSRGRLTDRYPND